MVKVDASTVVSTQQKEQKSQFFVLVHQEDCYVGATLSRDDDILGLAQESKLFTSGITDICYKFTTVSETQ